MNIRKTAMILAMTCLLGAAVPRQTAMAAEKPEYLKSVTYFGDEWPINYWGSEDKDMAANFEKIRQDGFNSIILVIPWREFQPNDGKTEFNQVAINRLNEVMACAEQHGLWVVLRSRDKNCLTCIVFRVHIAPIKILLFQGFYPQSNNQDMID